jgi:hypothetical protein
MEMEFKRCPACGFKWADRDDFLGDPDLKLVGYQVNFRELKAGLFLFNHVCKGTLAIYAAEFDDLYDGPLFTQRCTDGPKCPNYCVHENELAPCPNACECAFVREILQKLKAWPKRFNPVESAV